jgi:starch phosphorylase
MTLAGLYFSGQANAVSKLHGPISNKLFPEYEIKAITNGVNSETWTAPNLKKLFDEYLSSWRNDGRALAEVIKIPLSEIKVAHKENKNILIQKIKELSGEILDDKIFTLGWSRRFSPYKRPDLIFKDLERLEKIANKFGGLQMVFAGKAYPLDVEGQNLIKQIYDFEEKLEGKIKIVFLENYDLDLAKIIVAGVDLWLNTPLPFNEASGTSGMKAAHNGVPQFSTLDGWWPEGYKKGKTGWAIRASYPDDIYDILETEIMPTFYNNGEAWLEIMRQTIALNASYFNTERVLREYIEKMY